MCNDNAGPAATEPAATGSLTRRHFLGGVAASTAGGLLLREVGSPTPAAAAVSLDASPVSMAMHVHSSFSEQSASMESQLYQATTSGVDVLWWTDHDFRMTGFGYRSVVHFTDLTGETTDGPPWLWVEKTAGPLASSAGGIVDSPSSPNDPIVGGSLNVSARSSSSAPATLGFYAESHPADWNYHCNLYGQTLTIEVFPSAVETGGYLELLVTSSYHQAASNRPQGLYTLSYRFGGQGVPGTRSFSGTAGIINLPVLAGQWNTVSVTPCDDIAALWPLMPVHDFASYGLNLNAVSTGAAVNGYFDYLRFTREYIGGDLPVQYQQQLMLTYGPTYGTVTQYQGLEISAFPPHINWFGGDVSLSDYTGVDGASYPNFARDRVTAIHAGGGVASYNHPYGANDGPPLTLAQQGDQVVATVTRMLADDLLGCDILEVGYKLRGGCNTAHHLKLWDVLSRNARFVTGNGVNDDHRGIGWFDDFNNWYTSVWAASDSESDLVAALRAGRAWTASLSVFRGSLDLVADGSCPMGSVSVGQTASRQLSVLATGVPAGGKVQVIRGIVDYTGTLPNTGPIAGFPDTAFTGGSVTLSVDTSVSCFVRAQIRGPANAIVAISNPIWLLRETPPRGIPAARDVLNGGGISRPRRRAGQAPTSGR